jgi:hypothetical protein
MKFRRLFGKKKRKYPIKRDERGRSLRQQCMELFNEGKRPVEVAEELKMEESTAQRYFRQWKQLGPNFETTYNYTKRLLTPGSPYRDQNLKDMASVCKVPVEELEAALSRPHGLRRLMTGKTTFPGHEDARKRLQRILGVAIFLDSHLAKYGMTFQDVRFAFEQLMKRSQRYREEDDADVEEDNLATELTRSILEREARMDQEDRPRREKLTDEEQMAVIKLSKQLEEARKMRDLEMQYWRRIGELMAGGLTKEQAREKMYQDLIDKGDPEGAKEMREYQDKVHPLKADADNQVIPPPLTPPPSQSPPPL